MEQLLELLLHLATGWRLALGGMAGLLAALLLSLLVPSLPVGGWFLLGFLGATGGVVWHAFVHASPSASRRTDLSLFQKLLAFSAVAAMGGGWGALVQSSLGPTAAVACLLVTPAILGPILGAISKESVSVKSIMLATVASLMGFYTPYAINLLFQAGA